MEEDRDSKLNIVLFALTGFGNTVLKALLKDPSVNVESVFTVKYDNPFPYYNEEQLLALCHKRRIPCYYDMNIRSQEGITFLRQHNPDLIIMATFKEILTEEVISIPRLGVVNLHPSLLPQYRGPCPTNAALLNDEQVTGVTAHYITEKLDEGNVLLQRSTTINKIENDGQLRQQLAIIAGEMIPELIKMFSNGTKLVGTKQDHRLTSYANRPTIENGFLETATDIVTISRKVRAYNPLPGTSILIGENRIPVHKFEIFEDSRVDGIYEHGAYIDIVINFQSIRLTKKLD